MKLVWIVPLVGIVLTAVTNNHAHAQGAQDTQLLQDRFERRDESAELVGRLGIYLVDRAGEVPVGTNHHFKTNDRFRFEITSNQHGFLEVFHASPESEKSRLWPQSLEDLPVPLAAGTTYSIPPFPDYFFFEDDTGDESFYFVIQKRGPQDDFKKKPRRYTIKGLNNLLGIANKGVGFASGENQYLYFSTLDSSKEQASVLQFRLLHDD